MPTRITHFLHDSTVTGTQTLGTAFDAADVHAHDLQLYLPAFQKDARNYRGLLEGIHVHDVGVDPNAKLLFDYSDEVCKLDGIDTEGGERVFEAGSLS